MKRKMNATRIVFCVVIKYSLSLTAASLHYLLWMHIRIVLLKHSLSLATASSFSLTTSGECTCLSLHLVSVLSLSQFGSLAKILHILPSRRIYYDDVLFVYEESLSEVSALCMSNNNNNTRIWL